MPACHGSITVDSSPNMCCGGTLPTTAQRIGSDPPSAAMRLAAPLVNWPQLLACAVGCPVLPEVKSIAALKSAGTAGTCRPSDSRDGCDTMIVSNASQGRKSNASGASIARSLMIDALGYWRTSCSQSPRPWPDGNKDVCLRTSAAANPSMKPARLSARLITNGASGNARASSRTLSKNTPALTSPSGPSNTASRVAR